MPDFDAGVNRQHLDESSENMSQRQEKKRAVSNFEHLGQFKFCVSAQFDKASMGQLTALRAASSARGVDDSGEIGKLCRFAAHFESVGTYFLTDANQIFKRRVIQSPNLAH